MSTYVNTSMYQPNLYSNYNSYSSNGLNTGFSLSNYTDTSSVFGGQSMNNGYYSQQCMAPQQQNNNDSFMQQLVLIFFYNSFFNYCRSCILSVLLQRQNTASTVIEETIIEED